MLNYIKSCHQNTKFTFQEEYNIKISFPGTSITRDENEWQRFLIFPQETITGVYLNFNSHLPS